MYVSDRIRSLKAIMVLLVAFATVLLIGASAASARDLGTDTNYKTVVLQLKFNDDATPAITESQIRSSVFDGADSVHALFLESSWGKVGLTGVSNPDGDVYGYLTLPRPRPANNCEYANGNITDGVDAVAAAAGINLSQYDRVIYSIPSCAGAAFGGGGQAWLLGQTVLDVHKVAHEFTHSFTGSGGEGWLFEHAGAAYCSAGVVGTIPAAVGTQCMNMDYADRWDFMGSITSHIPSVFNRIRLGFLPSWTSADTSGEGTYDIYSTAESPTPGHTYNLRIPLEEPDLVNMASLGYSINAPKQPAFLNLEYRQPRGHFDADLGVPSNKQGVQIRMSRDFNTASYPSASNATALLDTDPHSQPYRWLRPIYNVPDFADYIYTPLPSGVYQEELQIDALTEDTGFYSPADDLLLRIVGRTAEKIQVKYSTGLSIADKTQVSVSGGVLTINAQSGFANDLYIRPSGGSLSVRDGNAPVLAAGGCSAASKNEALCPIAGIESVVINSGDRRDYIDASALGRPITVDSGDGNDVVRTMEAPATLNLGEGDDLAITRNGWGDSIACAGGSDTLKSDEEDTRTGCETVDLIETSIDSNPALSSTDTTPTFSFSSPRSGVTFECSNTLLGSSPVWEACTSPTTFGPLADGTYATQVRAVAADGDKDMTPDVRTYRVDTTAPVVTITYPNPNGSNATSVHSTQVYFTTESGATSTCSVNGQTPVSCENESTLYGLEEGPNPITITSTDAAGNVGSAVTTQRVDSTPPQTYIDAGPSGTIDDATAMFNFHSSEQQWNYECTLDGAPVTCSAGVYTTPTLTAGSHTFTVAARDSLYNLDPTPASRTFTVAGSGSLGASATTIASSVNLSTEGQLDWIHWGRSVAADVDRKQGTATIGNYSLLGSGGTVARSTTSIPTYTWTSGTPTATGSTASAINIGGAQNRGFRLVVPASDSGLRTLRLYAGVLATTGKLTATLSDGSAATVTDTSLSTSSTTTPANRVFAISYRSASAGATLTVDWQQNTTASSGRVLLHSATLVAGSDTTAPQTSISTGPADDAVITTATAQFGFTSSESGSTFQCKVDQGTYASCSTPFTTAALADGSHTFKVRATDSSGNVDLSPDTRTFWVAQPVGRISSSAPATAPSSVNLTSEGTLDWAHWGTSTTSLTPAGKSAATDVGALTKLGSGTVTRLTTGVPSASWTNGDSPTSNAGTTTALSTGGASARGFQLVAAASTTSMRVLKVYAGVTSTQGKFEATLSDGSAAAVADTSVTNSSGTTNVVYTVRYRARTAGATLTVKWTQNTSASAGRVSISSVSLAADPDVTPPTTVVGGPASGSVASTSTVLYSLAPSEGSSTSECRFDLGAWTACGATSTTPTLTTGTHSIDFRSIDAAGNVELRPQRRTIVKE